MITNRLKPLMNSIISNSQSSFILGHIITNNILIAHKLLHSMKQNSKVNLEGWRLRLICQKLTTELNGLSWYRQWRLWACWSLDSACDVLRHFSKLFHYPKWQSETPIHAILRFEAKESIVYYLFIFCAKGLSSLLNHSAEIGDIQGATVKRGGNRISHLFFAGNSIFFCKANLKEWNKMNSILNNYGRGSGQVINDQKSLSFFNSNITNNTSRSLVENIGGQISLNSDLYLGLPFFIGWSKYNNFW